MKFNVYVKSKVTYETKRIKIEAENKDDAKKNFKKEYKWMFTDGNWWIWKIKQGYSELYTKYKFNGIEWFKESLNKE